MYLYYGKLLFDSYLHKLLIKITYLSIDNKLFFIVMSI